MKVNLANHNYRFGDTVTMGQFFRSLMENSSEGPLAFMFKSPTALIMRGGVMGAVQMGLYKMLVDRIDKPGEKLS
jgi:hypothetical protein